MHIKHNLFPHSRRVEIIVLLPNWHRASEKAKQKKTNKQKGSTSRILTGISEEQSFWS